VYKLIKLFSVQMDPWRQLILFILIGLVSFLVGVFYFSITSNDVVVGFLSDDAIYVKVCFPYKSLKRFRVIVPLFSSSVIFELFFSVGG